MSFPSTAHTRAFTDAYRQSTVVAIATSPNITLVPPTDGRRARKGLGVKVRTPEVTEQGVECVVTAYTLIYTHALSTPNTSTRSQARDREEIDEHKLYGTHVRLFSVHFATEECPYGGNTIILVLSPWITMRGLR